MINDLRLLGGEETTVNVHPNGYVYDAIRELKYRIQPINDILDMTVIHPDIWASSITIEPSTTDKTVLTWAA
eukprot:3650246-Amphidinium_carterae.1